MILKNVKRFGLLTQAIFSWFRRPYFSFVQGHVYLLKEELSEIKRYVGKYSESTIVEFENRYGYLIGSGQVISFAAGRMGFFALMRVAEVKSGDEIILQGATCSVMANAILRVGATPIYADIDPNTFGSCAQAIERVITPKTRMIVAQHSFGIPCNIKPIVELAHSKKIFLLEDCALTLGSKVSGKKVGNFGDAALFSTDHSKPINTLIGGLVYTKNNSLATLLRKEQKNSKDLPEKKQKQLWNQFLLERKFCRPEKYGKMVLKNILTSWFKRNNQPFLSDDFSVEIKTNYPYPARMPSFLAYLGLKEIQRWPIVQEERKNILKSYKTRIGSGIQLPKAYYDPLLDIVPLRLAWSQKEGLKLRRKMSRFIDTSWTWFMQPIVPAGDKLANFGYQAGDCPLSEQIGPNMINLPCNISIPWAKKITEIFQTLN
mgnify:CR=1 FL=1|tara:strand:- start:6 stop:1298 length:1293 start_codon:yes stop_codon:yes gene_type:complete